MRKDKEIDVELTLEALEYVFRKYRYYKLTEPDEYLPTITPRYTLEMPNFSNVVNSKTENAAIKIADFKMESEKFFKKLQGAFGKLNEMERQIITELHLSESPTTRYVLASKMVIGERTLYRYQKKARLTLAKALKICVYKSVTEQ